MSYYVRTPGTCGEFLQGAIEGQRFLVTCPINRYSYAITKVQQPFPHSYLSLQPKAQLARRRVLESRQIPLSEGEPIYVRSDIVQGKGMASSSADIAAAAMATALSTGNALSMEELESIAISIEPTDAAFYPGIVKFDYVKGHHKEFLGPCPPMKILIFDEGGEIDTIAFNEQPNLQALINEKEDIIIDALHLFKQGIESHDISAIGEASTMSAFANQRILPKKSLYDIHQVGTAYHSVGTIIAHSGTVVGLLFPNDYKHLEQCRLDVLNHIPFLSYVDTVETTNEGITYMKRR